MGAWQGPLVQDLLGRWATTHSTVSPSCDLKVMDGMGGGGGGKLEKYAAHSSSPFRPSELTASPKPKLLCSHVWERTVQPPGKSAGHWESCLQDPF